MTTAEVSVGATYLVKFGDKELPVRLTEDSPYGGGWYGLDLSDNSRVRIATATRIIRQIDNPNTPKESTNMATATKRKKTTARNTAKENRAARRAAVAANTTTTVHNIEESTPMSTVKITGNTRSNKPAAPVAEPTVDAPYGFKADGVTPRKRPVPVAAIAAKRAAKPKPAAKPAATVTDTDTVTISKADLDALIAKAVAGANGTTDEPTAKPAAKRAASGKPVTVKLKLTGSTTNTIKFEYVGTADEPLVTAAYLMVPLVERFATDGSPVELAFKHYVPTGKQKAMPKSKIRYRGTEDTIRDLYVNRAGITKLGYTETNAPTVTIKVISDDEISLTFPKA